MNVHCSYITLNGLLSAECNYSFFLQKLFTPSVIFFTLYFLHIILFEVAAWVVLKNWGIGWVPYILAAILLATGQVCNEHIPE